MKIRITEEQLKVLENLEDVQKDIDKLKDSEVEKISDGYHTFDELYEFRKAYNSTLFNLWAELDRYEVHKSKLHHDGEKPFDGGWFIVAAKLPEGQISNHYEMKDWDLFQIPEEPKAKFPFDDHTEEDVIKRLKAL